MFKALKRILIKLTMATAAIFVGLPYIHSNIETIWAYSVYGMDKLKDALCFTLSKAIEFTLWALAKSLVCLNHCCQLIYSYAKRACKSIPLHFVLTTGQVFTLLTVALAIISGIVWCIASFHFPSLDVDVLEEPTLRPKDPRTPPN